MRQRRGRHASNEHGAASVEYGLMVALVAVAVVVSAAAVGSRVNNSVDRACDAIAGTDAHPATPSGGGGGMATAPGLHGGGC